MSSLLLRLTSDNDPPTCASQARIIGSHLHTCSRSLDFYVKVPYCKNILLARKTYLVSGYYLKPSGLESSQLGVNRFSELLILY
jgi:hypothetical protein